MLLSQRHLLVTRILPLAAVGVAVLMLVPSDFRAAANSFGQTAQPSSAPAAVKVSMPAPRIITPAVAPAPVAPVMAVPATAAPSAETLTAEAEASAPSAEPIPANLRDLRIGPSGVNVRADAVKGAAVLFTLGANAPVHASETVNGWVHVYTDDGSGWVYSSYLSDGSRPVPTQAVASARSGAAQSLVGHNFRLRSATAVYDQPGGERIYVLDGGERIQIADASGDWAHIVTDTDESGWIRVR